MEAAEKTSKRDFLMLALIGEGAGFRRGEVVGNKDRRDIRPIELFTRAKKKSDIPRREGILRRLLEGEAIVSDMKGDYRLIRDGQFVLRMRLSDPLPGLQVQDLREGAIWVKGKGGTQRRHPLPKWLYEKLELQVGQRKTGKIFDFSGDGLYKLTKKYAKLANVPDWNLVHPHRFRHFYIRSVWRKNKNNPVLIQHLARHATWDMTEHYIGEPEVGDQQKAVEELFAK
jgi:integrase